MTLPPLTYIAIERAAEIAGTSAMTLRQCFYILVSEGLIPNTDVSAFAAVSEQESSERQALSEILARFRADPS